MSPSSYHEDKVPDKKKKVTSHKPQVTSQEIGSHESQATSQDTGGGVTKMRSQ